MNNDVDIKYNDNKKKEEFIFSFLFGNNRKYILNEFAAIYPFLLIFYEYKYILI
jgi:hypothetical protein